MQETDAELPDLVLESDPECIASVNVAQVQLDSQRRDKLTSMLGAYMNDLLEDKTKIIDCAIDFNDVFAMNDGDRCEAKGVKHVIDTAESPSICQVPQRVPFALHDEIIIQNG